MPIPTSAHIHKHTGHTHLPEVWVCNLHLCLCADVLHQHITSRAALWLGLAVIDDQNPSLGLWTAHNTSADGYTISYISRGMASTGTGVTKEPLAICTLNRQSNLQPCLVWLYWQFVSICYNTPYFKGATGSRSILQIHSCAVSKRYSHYRYGCSLLRLPITPIWLLQFLSEVWKPKSALGKIQLHWLQCGVITSDLHLRLNFIFCVNTLLGRVRWKFQKPTDGSTAWGPMNYKLKFWGLEQGFSS